MKRTRTLDWSAFDEKSIMKKKKKQDPSTSNLDNDDLTTIMLPSLSSVIGSKSSVKTHVNHVYFNDDITPETTNDLIIALREAEQNQKQIAVVVGLDAPQPIYLHLTTNGGEIHAAFAVVDTIQQLSVPVYTVVDGFVASAGTLISLAGEKRFISRNAYMLLHELRSGIWGKMSSIEEEVENLKKIMAHITNYYMDKTNMPRKTLDRLLSKDVIWNADECVKKGVADSVM
jgi:ATP-dependent protease ClpP protease subunit